MITEEMRHYESKMNALGFTMTDDGFESDSVKLTLPSPTNNYYWIVEEDAVITGEYVILRQFVEKGNDV